MSNLRADVIPRVGCGSVDVRFVSPPPVPVFPDASAGIGKDDFSIRWTGRLVAPAAGTYVLHGDCDGTLRLWLDGKLVLGKDDHRRGFVQRKIELAAGKS